jgi:glycosyltransferase involved in cell wall biosynthesis
VGRDRKGASVVRVSVVIPTRNAERYLTRTLESVRGQTLPCVECIVVDSLSTDSTVRIARNQGVKVISFDSSMTRARLIGATAANGDFVLNLDADQVLSATAIQRCAETGADIVALGELSTGRGVVWRLTSLDRAAISKNWQANVDPISGAIRPRFYRRDLLLRSLNSIPDEIIDIKPCPYSEDSLIFLGTGVTNTGVGYVPDAVYHEEMDGLIPFMAKWRRYGITARAYRGTRFEYLVRARAGLGSKGRRAIASTPSLLMRGLPFALGYILG